MQSNENPDYSFLNSTNKPGPSKNKRIMIAVGGGIALLILVFMIGSLIFGGGGNAQSVRLAQLHTELLRVSEIGQDNSRGQAAKNIATTTNLTLKSSESAILAIANEDQKVEKKLLAAGQDPDTDEVLTDAEQRSQFDEIFIPLLVDEIKEYRSALEAAFNSSSSKSHKAVYDQLFKDLGNIVSATESSEE